MRLSKALALFGESQPTVSVRIHYFPFMIDPSTKAEGEEYKAYTQRRWGGDGWTHSMRALGAREGAPYANWKTWPNTTHASRMLMQAEQHDLLTSTPCPFLPAVSRCLASQCDEQAQCRL